MLKLAPPISNLERQRRFRARHPGYFGKYKVRMNQAAVEQVQPAAATPAQVPAPRRPRRRKRPRPD